MQKRIFFHTLLLVFPFVVPAQSTVQDWYKKGIELKHKDDYKNALAAFKNAIARNAAYNEAYYQAGWCCNELEKFEEAVDYLKKYNPTSNEYKRDKCNELGFSYLKLKNSKDAIDQYRQTLSLFPDNGIALRGLGNVYYEIEEDHEQAISYFEKALKVDEENSRPLYYKLGWLYNDQERYDDAISILLKAIEYDREDSGYREELGFAYYMKEEYESAVTQLNKALSLYANSNLAYYYKGLCFVATNKKGEALSIYYKLKEMDSDGAEELLGKINKMKP
ncbi:MAG TPA: tetratricopeptide repeat protein [Chitinophagaceae bacterium]|nr:tetratricopeptide repeat protein [Chitinophagaceae bacterium]